MSPIRVHRRAYYSVEHDGDVVRLAALDAKGGEHFGVIRAEVGSRLPPLRVRTIQAEEALRTHIHSGAPAGEVNLEIQP